MVQVKSKRQNLALKCILKDNVNSHMAMACVSEKRYEIEKMRVFVVPDAGFELATY